MVNDPVVAGGVVYVGSDDDHLHAIDSQTGQEKWKFKIDADVLSSPTVADSVVYFGVMDSYLYAVQ